MLALLLLAGCASAPTQFHTLVNPAGGSGIPAQAQQRSSMLAFTLDPVSVPRQADVGQLVVRGQDGTLRLAENQRWLAPLGEEMRASLSQQLQDRLGAADVSRVAAAAGTAVLRINVDVQRFESLPGRQVLIRAQWSLRELASTSILASCATQATETAAPGYAGLVEAYRRGVARIAAAIADGMVQKAAGAAVVACAEST